MNPSQRIQCCSQFSLEVKEQWLPYPERPPPYHTVGCSKQCFGMAASALEGWIGLSTKSLKLVIIVRWNIALIISSFSIWWVHFAHCGYWRDEIIFLIPLDQRQTSNNWIIFMKKVNFQKCFCHCEGSWMMHKMLKKPAWSFQWSFSLAEMYTICDSSKQSQNGVWWPPR